MKKNTIYLLIISIIILTSCGDNNTKNNKTNNNPDTDISIETKIIDNELSKYEQEIKIEYNKKKEELKIGNIITIKKGIPENLPNELINKNEETYTNTNVENYFFYVSNDDTEKIANNYEKKLKKSGWEKIEIQKPKIYDDKNSEENIDEDYEDYREVPITEEDVILTQNKDLIFQKDDNVINIFIREEIPENLQKMGLEGNYIEVYFIEPLEETIPNNPLPYEEDTTIEKVNTEDSILEN